MLMMMFACSGAGLQTCSPASSALVLTVTLTLTSMTPVTAVCVHCKGFVDGYEGSADYPLAKEITANGARAMADPKTHEDLEDPDRRLHPPARHAHCLHEQCNQSDCRDCVFSCYWASGRMVDLSDEGEFDKPSCRGSMGDGTGLL